MSSSSPIHKRTFPVVIIILIITGIFSFFFNIANKSTPAESILEEIAIQDSVYYDGIEVQLISYNISDDDYSGYPVLDVVYRFSNKADSDQSALYVANGLIFYQNFGYSIVQNIDEAKEHLSNFSVSYGIDDLILKSGESRDYTLKYIMEKDGNYQNFIYIHKNLYMDEYIDNLNKGKDLYKIITLGDL